MQEEFVNRDSVVCSNATDVIVLGDCHSQKLVYWLGGSFNLLGEFTVELIDVPFAVATNEAVVKNY